MWNLTMINVLYTKATIKYTNLENRMKYSKSIPVGFIKLELAKFNKFPAFEEGVKNLGNQVNIGHEN
jgi:hypothetical protein